MHHESSNFAGGVGSRLWPLSRKNLQNSLKKLSVNTRHSNSRQIDSSRTSPERCLCIYRNFVCTPRSKAVRPLPPDHVIGEPMMRDVGPAVGLVTAILTKESPNEPMVILWSDHLVKKKCFQIYITVNRKARAKRSEKIIFVSQKPRFASENLGWIEYGKEVVYDHGISFHSFVDFQYRPDKTTAEKYFKSGHHAWNLGYFVTTPQFLWEQYKRFVPNVYEGLSRIRDAWRTDRYQDVLNSIYPTLEKYILITRYSKSSIRLRRWWSLKI